MTRNRPMLQQKNLTFATEMQVKKHILPFIIIAQLSCTSLWFAGNSVAQQMLLQFGSNYSSVSAITSAVQLGFIIGTLLLAFFGLVDRYKPSRIFFVCALLGACFNILSVFDFNTYYTILVERFLVGVCLAGIYPVGMKIASDFYTKGLGKSLGFLVGALVLGTAFPHLIKTIPSVEWKTVLLTTSLTSLLGGLIMLFGVGDGPQRVGGQKFRISQIEQVFSQKEVRSAALGYFGHMWELYTFWAFVPYLIAFFNDSNTLNLNISAVSFGIIAVGSVGCVLSATLSQKYGLRKMALSSLAISGLCCIVSPLIYTLAPTIFISILTVWGLTVVADSPLFSTLVAQSSKAELRGTTLTLVNSIGFLLTIFSIEFISVLKNHVPTEYLMLPLAIGPLLVLLGTLNNKKRQAAE